MFIKKAPSEGAKNAILAYTAWGLFPLYWKLLQNVPSLSVLCHRIFWSFLFYTGYLVIRDRKWKGGGGLSLREWGVLVLSSTLIGANWFLYIWAVNSGHIIETSLGYFINPLVNILFGVWLLDEKLLPYQKIAVALAVIGVGVLTWEGGRLPWIALVLAITFGLYGLIRKRVNVGSVEGGQVESLVLLLPVVVVVYLWQLPLIPENSVDWIWLVGSGFVTGIPLIWFVEAARRLPYYLMGFFQYLAPTLQFLTGVVIFHETLTPWKVVGFTFIWLGIAWLLWKTFRRAAPLR